MSIFVTKPSIKNTIKQYFNVYEYNKIDFKKIKSELNIPAIVIENTPYSYVVLPKAKSNECNHKKEKRK